MIIHYFTGVVPDGAGVVSDPQYSTSSIPDDQAPGASETHNGVYGWSLDSHGDDVSVGFLRVWGPVKDAASATWYRISELTEQFFAESWNT